MTYQIDAVVCLNGDIPNAAFFERYAAKPLIAADGAAHKLRAHGIIPSVIAGDFDSIGDMSTAERESLFPNAEWWWQPDQESNDFEKILVEAHARGMSSLLVCGIHGGDLEHTLNNWSVLMRYAWTHTLLVADRDRIAIPIVDVLELACQPGDLISLIPQPVARLTTRGLQWELRDEHLELGVREGARNRATAERVIIRVHHGSLLVFFDSDRIRVE